MAADFEPDSSGEVTGTVTDIWFRNPHVRYALEVTNANGQKEAWEVLSNNITSLRRIGWNADTLKVGDVITVSGALGRAGAKKIHMENVLRNGAVLMGGETQVAEAPNPNAINASADKNYGYGVVDNDYPVDITGLWRNRYKWSRTVDDLEPKPIPFTAEGRRIHAATESWHDPSFRCIAPGLPRIFGAPYNMEIVDAGDHYLVVHVEHNTPRRIWMDGRTAPAEFPESAMGYSVGHWEGKTLVIETTHLSSGWLDGSGYPMSGSGTRVVEHWKQNEDGLTMDRTMWIHDPYYTQPLVRYRYSARDDAPDVNEQAPCDPDSYYRDLYNANRLEAHFNR